MRVASLLPAATEIVAALGMTDHLVGVSHECDWPDTVREKPRLTHCAIHGNALPSDAIDRWVRTELPRTGSLYTIDEAQLRQLRPDVIVTQGLCDVCAPSHAAVAGLAARLPGPPAVLTLDPSTLDDVLRDVHAVGAALGVPGRAAAVVADLEARIAAVRAAAAGRARRRCVLLEWIAPPFCSGHWGPELVEIAGGVDPLGRPGEDAAEVPWTAVCEARPEVLVLACCGYDIPRTMQDLPLLRQRPGWRELPAVRAGAVYVADGCAYFSRPGPRIVDSLEILAAILGDERLPERGVVRVEHP
jgi:iron complex transport system substrate-binding protein